MGTVAGNLLEFPQHRDDALVAQRPDVAPVLFLFFGVPIGEGGKIINPLDRLVGFGEPFAKFPQVQPTIFRRELLEAVVEVEPIDEETRAHAVLQKKIGSTPILVDEFVVEGVGLS